MKISIVIATYNSEKFILDCLSSIEEATQAIPHEILIIDNNSHDKTKKRIRQHSELITLIENPGNYGFARAVNLGIAKSCGEFCLLMNPDIIVKSKDLSPLIQFMEQNPKVGICGCKLLNLDDSLQFSKGSFSTLPATLFRVVLPRRMRKYHLWGYDKVGKCEWVTGAFMLIRREVIDQMGGFDENYFLYYEDMDYCRKAQLRGWETFFFHSIEAYHLSPHAISRKGNQIEREIRKSRLYYFRKNNLWFSYFVLFLLTGIFEEWTFLPERLIKKTYPAVASFKK